MDKFNSSNFGNPKPNNKYSTINVKPEKLAFLEQLFAKERPHEIPQTELNTYIRTVLHKLSKASVPLTYEESYAMTLLSLYVEEWENFVVGSIGKRQELFDREDAR